MCRANRANFGTVSRQLASGGLADRSRGAARRARPWCQPGRPYSAPGRPAYYQRRLDDRERHVDHRLEVGHRDLLVRAVDVRHPVREHDAGDSTGVEDARVGAASHLDGSRLETGARERREREPHDGIVQPEAIPVVELLHGRLDLAVRDRRRKGERVDDLLDEREELALVARARSTARSHRSATTLRAVPPRMVPTFAVVSSSIRPRLRSAIPRAAPTIADRPSSGLMPACAERPRKTTSTFRWCGAATTTSPIGPAWS